MSTNGVPEGGAATAEQNQNSLLDSRAFGSGEFAPAGQDYMSIMALWDILLKRRWTVVTVLVVISTLVAIVTFRTKPVYKAAARVEVEAEMPLIQSLNDLYQYEQNSDDDTFLETQIEIIKSDALAWRTIEQLRLTENPNFAPPQPANSNRDSDANKQRLIAAFKSGVSVQLVPKTRMLLVGYESTSPELTARISNELVTNYIEYNFRQKYDSTRQASAWLEQQLDELKAKVETSQQALVDYERNNAIAGTGDKQSVQEQMLSDLSKDLTTAQSDRIQKESFYNQLRTSPGQMGALTQNPLLQKLEEKQADLQSQYTEVISQYGPNYPKALRVQQLIAENRGQIEQEQKRVVDRAHADYMTAVNRENLALAAVNQQKDDLGKVNQLLVEHNILKRDFETNQQLYQNLLQKLKDATVSAGLRSTNIHLVDSAMTPTAPIRPRKMLNVMVGLFSGIVLGVMVAFAQEALDQSVKSIVEIEALLGAPALGIIPLNRLGRAAYGMHRHRRSMHEDSDVNVALISVKRPRSALAEAYRSLRTAVLLSNSAQPPKTILITSTKSGEGKTVTSLNLASVMAQRKAPVLLIDCDLRKSGVASAVKISNEKGLTTVLAGGMDAEDAIQPHSELPGLWILPAGPGVPNPAELLSSDKMVELIQQLSDRYEHVIIDSPPVLAVTDAAILSAVVDGVLLIVEGGSTHKGALARSHHTIVSSGGKVLGVVFNKYDHRREGAYGYGSYYHYYPYSHYGDQ